MAEVIYGFITGLSRFGWAMLLLSWFMVVALAVVSAVQSDFDDRRRRRKRVFDYADEAADRIDDALGSAEEALPPWCTEEDVDAYRAEMTLHREGLASLQSASGLLRQRLASNQLSGLRKLAARGTVEARYFTRVSDAARKKGVKRSSRQVVSRTLLVIERRVKEIDSAMRVLDLSPIMLQTLGNDLHDISRKSRAFREAYDKGTVISHNGLIYLLRMSVEIHEMQDVLVDFVGRKRNKGSSD